MRKKYSFQHIFIYFIVSAIFLAAQLVEAETIIDTGEPIWWWQGSTLCGGNCSSSYQWLAAQIELEAEYTIKSIEERYPS